ncbi:FAD-dependent oxidoreductase [Streptomyces sp. NPDC048603]|uniref:tryptophan halogenase family protein n=1 Tax=Streptomyces sp. NPDC048603 TaxID=3365577 RepID=UPI00371A886B
MTEGNVLDRLLESFPQEAAAGVRAWLADRAGAGTDPSGLMARLAPAGGDVRPASDGDPRGIRHVGVIGGGTAGLLTALALKAKRPWLEVTLVESTSIPIIGVGEATTPHLTMFLHHYLGIDPAELYAKVLPTWKLGIKFDWGPGKPFIGPFDWAGDSVGLVGAIRTGNGSPNGATLGSVLMLRDRAPVYRTGDGDGDGGVLSLMKYLPFAYHLDNGRLVSYLHEVAARRGVHHVEATLEHVALSDDEWVDHLRTDDGRALAFDLYVDCTGFRSRLLGQALRTRYLTYDSSLFTDSAITGNTPHHGDIVPYTQATTMNAGWAWRIPTREDDHRGYVYSSNAITDDQAVHEFRTRFPGITEPRQVRFRSGRHEKLWRGNVIAIGNSYGFVEPLESSGLLMIATEILTLAAFLPASWSDPQPREAVNTVLGQQWDGLRWLLAIHYRFNTRLDTPFWKACNTTIDVSGFQPLLDLYAAGAPLCQRDPVVRALAERSAPLLYGLASIDLLLLGQQVPTRLLTLDEPLENWHARRRAAEALAGHAMTTRQALEAFDTIPELHQELLHAPDSWANPHGARLMGIA